MIYDRFDPTGAQLNALSSGISAPRPTFSQNFNAAEANALAVESPFSRNFELEAQWGPIVEALNEQLGPVYRPTNNPEVTGAFPDPTYYYGYGLVGMNEEMYQQSARDVIAQALEYNERNPGVLSEDLINSLDMDVLEQRAIDSALATREDYSQIIENSRGTGGFARFAGELSGGIYEITRDPWQTATLGLGGTGGLLKFAFQEFLLNAGIEVMRQPGVAEWYETLGLEYTAEDFFRNVAVSGVAGAGFATGIRVGTSAIARGISRLTPQQVQQGINAIQETGAVNSLDGRAALEVAQAINEIDAENPGISASAHTDLTLQTKAALERGEIPQVQGVPVEQIDPAAIAAQPRPTGGALVDFDPRDILVDAETFQFKAGGDEMGVTQRLQGVTEWNPYYANTITVYQYRDGRVYVADGHQRVGLAKRLLAENPNADIRLSAHVFREADGVSPQEAMVIAAGRNIAEGSGTAIDAARILRFDPERLSGLPPRSEVVRQARDMMELTDEAFGAIINEVIPANYGAIVGRILGDRPELQNAAIEILAKSDPENVFQAEAIVRQVREADAEQVTQISLFGEELVTESLYPERARILDRAFKALRRDRAAFESLTKNADRIEGEGSNVLDRRANERRAEQNAQTIAILQTLANRKGPLSDALSAAARQARDTGNYVSATNGFVDAIGRSISEGDFDRISSGELGRINDAPTEISRRSITEDRAVEEFDEPNGPGVEKQASQLQTDMLGTQVEPGTRQELSALVNQGAAREVLDQHPAIRTALQEIETRPETFNLPDFGTESWHNARVYNIEGQEITGTARALQQWEMQAEALAWVEKGIAPQPVARNREATIILGPPAAGKSTIANELAVARKSAILDGDEIKKSIPEFEDGTGAKAVHEESSVLTKMLMARMLDRGTNVTIPKVGDNEASITGLITLLKDSGYSVRVVNMAVSPENAYVRNIGRFAATGRLVPPTYLDYVGTRPSSVYQSIKSKGIADGYAEIDNNGPFGSVKYATEIIGQDPLEGSPFRLAQRGEEAGRAPDGGRAQPGQEIPARVSREDVSQDLLFKDIEQDQLMEGIGLDEEVALDLTIDPETGEPVSATMTMRDVKRNVDQEDAIIQRLEFCTR